MTKDAANQGHARLQRVNLWLQNLAIVAAGIWVFVRSYRDPLFVAPSLRLAVAEPATQLASGSEDTVVDVEKSIENAGLLVEMRSTCACMRVVRGRDMRGPNHLGRIAGQGKGVARSRGFEQQTWYSFKINARMVLDTEENGLISKYNLQNVILTPGDTRRDVRNAILISIPISLLIYFSAKIPIGLALIHFLALSFIVYHQIREQVRVNDLLTGRDFKARSLLQLLQKEHAIRKMSAVFANVVAQARTWHEPEVIELEPQPLLSVLERPESERAAA